MIPTDTPMAFITVALGSPNGRNLTLEFSGGLRDDAPSTLSELLKDEPELDDARDDFVKWARAQPQLTTIVLEGTHPPQELNVSELAYCFNAFKGVGFRFSSFREITTWIQIALTDVANPLPVLNVTFVVLSKQSKLSRFLKIVTDHNGRLTPEAATELCDLLAECQTTRLTTPEERELLVTCWDWADLKLEISEVEM